jgi:hypothetical protein
MSRFEPVGAPLPGQTYEVSLSLVETVRREQQQRGGSRGAQGRPGATTLGNWLRQRACSWQPVQLPANAARLELTSPPGRALPRCREVPPANEMAYVALAPRGAESCAGWCTGDVSGRAERAASTGPSPQCHSSPHTASKGGRAKSCPILCDHPGHGSHLQHFQRPRLRPPLAPGLSARARPRTEPGIPSTRPTRA